MASNYTTNYQLNQWEAADQVLRTEFNRDNQRIDAALAGLAAQNTELAVAVANKGNCQLWTSSYVGTGTSGAGGTVQLTFPTAPMLLMVSGLDTVGISILQGQMIIVVRGGNIPIVTNWSNEGKTVSWYYDTPGEQLNQNGITYKVLALLEA